VSDGEFKAWDDDEDKVEGKTGAAAPTSDATQALLTLSNGTAEYIEEHSVLRTVTSHIAARRSCSEIASPQVESKSTLRHAVQLALSCTVKTSRRSRSDLGSSSRKARTHTCCPCSTVSWLPLREFGAVPSGGVEGSVATPLCSCARMSDGRWNSGRSR
jgi:hypothetical protein